MRSTTRRWGSCPPTSVETSGPVGPLTMRASTVPLEIAWSASSASVRRKRSVSIFNASTLLTMLFTFTPPRVPSQSARELPLRLHTGIDPKPRQHAPAVREIADNALDRFGHGPHQRRYGDDLVTLRQVRLRHEIDHIETIPPGQVFLAEPAQIADRCDRFGRLSCDVQTKVITQRVLGFSAHAAYFPNRALRGLGSAFAPGGAPAGQRPDAGLAGKRVLKSIRIPSSPISSGTRCSRLRSLFRASGCRTSP